METPRNGTMLTIMTYLGRALRIEMRRYIAGSTAGLGRLNPLFNDAFKDNRRDEASANSQPCKL